MVLALANNPTLGVLPIQIGHLDLLASFAYPITIKSFDLLEGSKPDLFYLDSGAFTAWSKGRQVDLREYVTFAQGISKRWPQTVTVNLDVIPGQPGRTSTKAEREEGMERSLANADVLRGHGLRVMEVFHQDEPASFLAKLIERRREGEPLGISPRNDMSIKARCAWLKTTLRWMVHNGGRESIPPCHGLAATAEPFLDAFPFYSVDSSSWSVAYRYGRVITDSSTELVTSRFGAPGTTLTIRLDQPDQRAVLFAQVRESIRSLNRRARHSTSVWAARGISWQDDPIAKAA